MLCVERDLPCAKDFLGIRRADEVEVRQSAEEPSQSEEDRQRTITGCSVSTYAMA